MVNKIYSLSIISIFERIIVMIKNNIWKISSLNILLLTSTMKGYYFKIILLYITLFFSIGCYTVLNPPLDILYQPSNHSVIDGVDTVIVENRDIHNYYYNNCIQNGNCCNSKYWRYNNWTGSYYCDPYYYNYHYYSYDSYWLQSHPHWDYYDYSDNYLYQPSKKTKRDRSFTRITANPIEENSSQNNTANTTSQSANQNSQNEESYTENTGNSATSTAGKTITSNAKPKRKRNRKPL